MDLERFDAITFDCYGTLIDWESGILEAVRQMLHGDTARSTGDEALLALFGRLESQAEAGSFRRYRAVLEDVAREMGHTFGQTILPEEAAAFADSVSTWPPFADSARALRAMGGRYRLAVVSNVDDDLFRGSAEQLGVDFDEVVTAQQVGSYKPAPTHFEEVLRRLRLPKERVLHVAQSRYHDIEPANRLGFSCVWVDRRSGREGGATRPSDAMADLTVPDLDRLVRYMGLEGDPLPATEG